MKEIEIKINKDLCTPSGKYNAGTQLIIFVDSEGTPLDHFWRSRLKDSAIDDCIEVINKSTKKSKK